MLSFWLPLILTSFSLPLSSLSQYIFSLNPFLPSFLLLLLPPIVFVPLFFLCHYIPSLFPLFAPLSFFLLPTPLFLSSPPSLSITFLPLAWSLSNELWRSVRDPRGALLLQVPLCVAHPRRPPAARLPRSGLPPLERHSRQHRRHFRGQDREHLVLPRWVDKSLAKARHVAGEAEELLDRVHAVLWSQEYFKAPHCLLFWDLWYFPSAQFVPPLFELRQTGRGHSIGTEQLIMFKSKLKQRFNSVYWKKINKKHRQLLLMLFTQRYVFILVSET